MRIQAAAILSPAEQPSSRAGQDVGVCVWKQQRTHRAEGSDCRAPPQLPLLHTPHRRNRTQTCTLDPTKAIRPRVLFQTHPSLVSRHAVDNLISFLMAPDTPVPRP
jgi:hypothetical protein